MKPVGPRWCPECWGKVGRTPIHDCIQAHVDHAGAVCGGGGQPYRITLSSRPKRWPIKYGEAA